MGLAETGRIGTIVIHPDQREHRAGLRARPRDRTAERARRLPHRGRRQDLAADAVRRSRTPAAPACRCRSKDPNVVIAGTWEIYLQTHVLESGGMGSGIHLSRDGGKTFTKVTASRPAEVAVRQDRRRDRAVGRQPDVRADSDRLGRRQKGLQGLKSEAQGSLWRSDDGGKTWNERELGSPADRPRRLLHPHSRLARRSGSPADRQQHAVALARRRKDLGRAAAAAAATVMTSGGIRTPTMAGHYIVTGDGGMGIYGSPSNPTGNTSVSLPIGQMYRVTVDQRSPYWVYSDRQDDGSMRICERSADRAGERAVVRAASAAGAGTGRGGRRRRARAAARRRRRWWRRRTRRRRAGRARRRRACRRASPATRIPSRTTIASCGARATPRTSRRSTRSAARAAR